MKKSKAREPSPAPPGLSVNPNSNVSTGLESQLTRARVPKSAEEAHESRKFKLARHPPEIQLDIGRHKDYFVGTI